MRIFSFPISPANYTLDVIDNVYEPKGIKYAFIHGSSEASDKGCRGALVLGQIKGLHKRISVIWRILKENDIFIVNSYTDKISFGIIAINILFFKKPMGLSSDTQLHVPAGILRRCIKQLLLGFLFTREYIYGLPGGTKTHTLYFSYYGMDASKIILLPMMVDNARYYRTEAKEPKETFRFVFIGRLVPCKRVSDIIKALRIVCRTKKNIALHIIGDGDEMQELSLLAKGLPVIFHGRLYDSNMIEMLHTMHCLILYSSFEQWGLVVNEALASGIPCIVSDQVGARFDLIEKAPPTGLVVNMNEVEALAEAMIKMASNKDMWRQYSSNALLRMKSWDYGKYTKQLDCFVAHAGGQLAC